MCARLHSALPVALALLAGSAVAAAGAEPAAASPTIHLSWRQPWGHPGAVEHLTAACDDTAAVDTLYLTFEAGRDAATFYGMFARLRFIPASGDTLMPFWHFQRGTENTGGLWAWFDADSALPVPDPWPVAGNGAPAYVQGPEGGRLDLVYAVPSTGAGPIDSSTTYCYGRIMIHHRWLKRAAGCERPMCIEWAEAKASFGSGGDVEAGPGGHRFVTWNSTDRAACIPVQRAMKTRAWRPSAAVDSLYRAAPRTPDEP
jgi:hypothetical protein